MNREKVINDGGKGREKLELTSRLLSINYTRTQCQKFDILRFKLSSEFRNDHVQSRFHGAVRHLHWIPVRPIRGIHQVSVRESCTDDDHLPNSSFQNEREERVDGVDDAQHVGVEACMHIVVQDLGLGTRGECR